MNLDVNNVSCIKLGENFGGWTAHNICTGTESFIPWGDLSWVAFWFVVMLLSLVGFVLYKTTMFFITGG